MKTVIDDIWQSIEKYGHKAVLSQKQHYLDKQETLIKSAWQSGRNSGLMGTHTNENEFYNNLIHEENESNG